MSWFMLVVFIMVCYRDSHDFFLQALLVPESFSSKGTAMLLDAPPSLATILSIVSSYELDTHVEVVLVGSVFDHEVKKALSLRLESLSTVAAHSSPLAFVREKLVYHVALGKVLEKDLSALVLQQAEAVEPARVGAVLAEYHKRASTSTTLFVLHSFLQQQQQQQPAATEEVPTQYAYASELSYCKQHTFIAKNDAFAWMDLSALADTIMPAVHGNDVLPAVHHLYNFGSEENNLLNELSSAIHRAGEALCPFPYPAFSSEAMNSNSSFLQRSSLGSSRHYETRFSKSARDVHRLDHFWHPKKIEVSIITICVSTIGAYPDDDQQCEDDQGTVNIVNQLSQLYASSSLQISSDQVSIRLEASPQLVHAFHASIHYHQSGVSKTINVRSKELVYWLSNSELIKGIVARGASFTQETLYLPLFVFQIGPLVETYFDNTVSQTLSMSFPEPAGGGWGLPSRKVKAGEKPFSDEEWAEAARMADDLIWPSKAIVALRHSPKLGFPSFSPSSSSKDDTNRLECAGIGLPLGEDHANNQMFHVLRETIWGISSPQYHYSAAFARVVRDYVWFTPLALQTSARSNINGEQTFREKRAVLRHVVMHRAELLLSLFAKNIGYAAALVPPANVTFLLDLHVNENKNAKAKASALARRMKQQMANQPTSISSEQQHHKTKPPSTGLLEAFLFYMHEAASDFAHLDYELALLQLNNAESRLFLLEKRIEELVAARTGSITCDALPTTIPADSLHNHLLNARLKESSSDLHKESKFLGWSLLAIGIFVGALFGYVSSSKLDSKRARSGLRARRI